MNHAENPIAVGTKPLSSQESEKNATSPTSDPDGSQGEKPDQETPKEKSSVLIAIALLASGERVFIRVENKGSKKL